MTTKEAWTARSSSPALEVYYVLLETTPRRSLYLAMILQCLSYNVRERTQGCALEPSHPEEGVYYCTDGAGNSWPRTLRLTIATQDVLICRRTLVDSVAVDDFVHERGVICRWQTQQQFTSKTQ